MSENNCVEDLSNQLDNIENIYNGYLSDTTNHKCLFHLCIAIFDYVQFNILNTNGFDIINMDIERQKQIAQDIDEPVLERSRSIFRISLYLTIFFNTFNHFIGMLYTAELIPLEDLNKQLQPEDPKKNIVVMIKRLHDIKIYTNIDFPSIYKALLEAMPIISESLKKILDTFDEESAILYNQEKRRIFKPEIFGTVVLDLPDDEELTEMKRSCNFVEPFKESV
jgi:hypothetical protein